MISFIILGIIIAALLALGEFFGHETNDFKWKTTGALANISWLATSIYLGYKSSLFLAILFFFAIGGIGTLLTINIRKKFSKSGNQ